MASDLVRGYAAWRDERAKTHRVELATRMMESLIAGRRGPVEPGLWATAFALADAMPTFRDATVPHEEPALSDLIVMRAPPGPPTIEHAEADCVIQASSPGPCM